MGLRHHRFRGSFRRFRDQELATPKHFLVWDFSSQSFSLGILARDGLERVFWAGALSEKNGIGKTWLADAGFLSGDVPL